VIVKVVWQSVRSYGMKNVSFSLFAVDERNDVTYLWLCVEFFVLEWSARSRVRFF